MQTCTCTHDKTEHRFGVERCTRCGCTQFKLQPADDSSMDEGTITTLPETGPFTTTDAPASDTPSFDGGGGDSGGGGASDSF